MKCRTTLKSSKWPWKRRCPLRGYIRISSSAAPSLQAAKNSLRLAADYLNEVQLTGCSPPCNRVTSSLLGKTCDQLGQFDEAFSAFEKQNALTEASAEAQRINARWLSEFNSNAEKMPGPPMRSRTGTGRSRGGPSHPRILDRISQIGNDAAGYHSAQPSRDISVVEEKPMVTAMGKALQQGAHDRKLSTRFRTAEVHGLRDAYFDRTEAASWPKS